MMARPSHTVCKIHLKVAFLKVVPKVNTRCKVEIKFFLSYIVSYTYLYYKKGLLLRCIHHFKSDIINNMDHMRISGTESSSVILIQTM